ncbi:MAG: hypothetical protein AAB361_00270 [Patescibacteria group bacterium]
MTLASRQSRVCAFGISPKASSTNYIYNSILKQSCQELGYFPNFYTLENSKTNKFFSKNFSSFGERVKNGGVLGEEIFCLRADFSFHSCPAAKGGGATRNQNQDFLGKKFGF